MVLSEDKSHTALGLVLTSGNCTETLEVPLHMMFSLCVGLYPSFSFSMETGSISDGIQMTPLGTCPVFNNHIWEGFILGEVTFY